MSDEAPQPDSPKINRRRRGPLNRIRRLVSTERRGSKRKINIDPDIVMASLFAMILLLGAFVALTLYQQSQISQAQKELDVAQKDINVAQEQIRGNQWRIQGQQRNLEHLEQRDRINSYQAAYRFCTREAVNRVVVHWFIGKISDRRRSRALLRRLEQKSGLPVLDCEPNVRGEPARYQSPAKQHLFIRRWVKRELSAAELGICRIPIGAITDPRACLK